MRRAFRRFAIVAALATASVTAYADHPVTIQLRSGERMAGQFADLHNDLVYLRINRSQEPRIPLSTIAVMDFTNGANDGRDLGSRRTRQAEHLLVLRNGRRIEGRFEGLTGDDHERGLGHGVVGRRVDDARPADDARRASPGDR